MQSLRPTVPRPSNRAAWFSVFPQNAIHQPHAAGMLARDHQGRRVGALERHELAVGDQQAEFRRLVDPEARIPSLGADAQEVPVAAPGLRGDETVAHVVAVAERVDRVKPVRLAEDEAFAVGQLPLVGLALERPPGIEMDVFQAAGVVDFVEPDSQAQRLARRRCG